MDKQRNDKKKQFVEEKRGGVGKKVVVLAVLVAVVAGAAFMLLRPGASSGYTSVKSVGGEIRIDLDKVSDGQAHFFTYNSNQGQIGFFVVKSVDGVVRAAFDACDVCYKSKKGYHQEGEFMVCNNCGQQFRTDLVNEIKGGCNPAPLQRRVDGRQLVISEQDMIQGAGYFGS